MPLALVAAAALVSAAVVQQGLFSAGIGPYAAFRIPALVACPCTRDDALKAAPPNCVFAFAEGRTLSSQDAGPIDIVLRRSSDGGRSWGELEVAVSWSDGATTCGNPSPVCLDTGEGGERGELVLVFTVNNTWPFVTRLSEDGAWAPARNLSGEVKLPGWGWMATGPGHGVQLRGPSPFAGRLVVPVDRKLLNADISIALKVRASEGQADARVRPSAYARFVTSNADAPHDVYAGSVLLDDWALLPEFVIGGGRAAALLSDDGGRRWRIGGAVPSHNSNSNEASIAELDDGTLAMSFRVQSPTGAAAHCRHFALSADGGETWGAPFTAEDCAVLDPVCQGAILHVRGLGVLTSGPDSSRTREAMSVQRAAHADATGVRGWQLVARLSHGPAAYSDLALLPLPSVAQGIAIGVLYELGSFGGGPASIVFASLQIDHSE